MWETAIPSVLAVSIGVTSTYLLMKKTLKRDNLLEISEDVLSNGLDLLLTDEKTQKQVYALGVLLGNGIKQGLGMSKGGGKFNLEALIGQGVGAFFQNVLGRATGATEPQSQEIPQHLRG